MKSHKILEEIKQLSKQGVGLSVNELRIIIALERVVARIERDEVLAKQLIFKGGIVMLKSFKSSRFTRDLDALATEISKEELQARLTNCLETDLNDGLWFGDIRLRELDEQGEYGAYRFDCAFQLGHVDKNKIHKLSRIHIDIGFSDKLLTLPTTQQMPSILTISEAISWSIYPVEYIVAEKLETLFARGSANSRAKDVYDLIHLLPRCLNKETLVEAIRQTFNNRNSQMPVSFSNTAELFDTTVLEKS